MIFVHYDNKTGKILGAYDSSNTDIPSPNIEVLDSVWEKVSGNALYVDLSTLSFSDNGTKITENVSKLRLEAYRNESDPLFFMYQRGECSKEDWLNKVEEIKKRYPKQID